MGNWLSFPVSSQHKMITNSLLVLACCIIKGRPGALRQGGFFERDLAHHNRTDN